MVTVSVVVLLKRDKVLASPDGRLNKLVTQIGILFHIDVIAHVEGCRSARSLAVPQ